MSVVWSDPEVVSKSQRALVLFAHAGFGLYIWEFIVTLDYDIALVRRKRSFNVGVLLYLLPRYSTAFGGIVLLRMCNAMTPDVNCKLWNHLLHGFGYASNTFTSGLLYARVCALSGYNRLLIWSLAAAYAGSWAMAVKGIIQSDAIHIQEQFLCQPIDIHKHRLNLSYLFAFDMVCLISMMLCLSRMHRGSSGSIWMVLARQGVVYFISICSAYLFVVTCVIVDRNDLLSLTATIIALLITTISSTRMQRGLVDYVTRESETTSGIITTVSMPVRARYVVRSDTFSVEHSATPLPLTTATEDLGRRSQEATERKVVVA